MTKEEETASIIVGVGLAIVVVFFIVILAISAYFTTDSDGSDRAHPASEWRR